MLTAKFKVIYRFTKRDGAGPSGGHVGSRPEVRAVGNVDDVCDNGPDQAKLPRPKSQ
jgi:hypothetical protein